MEALAAAALQLLAEVAQLVADAQNAKNQDHAAVLARVQAARAALASAEAASDALAQQGQDALAGK
jgi:hypothetical protein